MFDTELARQQNVIQCMSVCLEDFNPILTNWLSHRYHLGESTFMLRGIGSDFNFLYIFNISEQTEYRSVASQQAILFAYVPEKGHQSKPLQFLLFRIEIGLLGPIEALSFRIAR